MRILLINIRFKYLGGPERYLFNLRDLLQDKGHEVIPFAIRYDGSEPSIYEEYFVPPLSTDGALYYKDQRKDLKSIYTTFERNIYSRDVERNLSRLIDDVKPDFAIVLIYLRKLSPAVLVALSNRKIPFIVRLSDFGMICANHILFRENSICELCIHGNPINSVRYRCVHNSLAASLVNYAATRIHHWKGYFHLISDFVSPSKFLIERMVEAGWERERFHHVPTFASSTVETNAFKRSRQLLYAGRLDRAKGIHILLEAIRILRDKFSEEMILKLAGRGETGYINELHEYCQSNALSTVEFLGELDQAELNTQFNEAMISIVPSLWYDNLPNSALESLACGTPIIGPNHGCFPEIILEGETGFLFEPGNASDLALKIHDFMNSHLAGRMSHQAINFIRTKHSPEVHYVELMKVIDGVRSRAKL